MLNHERQETEDGFEMTLQCNHLGHFLLTNLLLDKLKEAPKARIVNVSSIGHKWSKLDLSDLNYTARKFDGMVVYYDTKLINILFTNELSRRLQDTNVTSYVLHPGVIESEFWRNHSKLHWYWFWFVDFTFWLIKKMFMKNSWQGAQTTIYCAIDESLDGISGKYYSDCSEAKVGHPMAKDENAAKELWEKSSKMVQL